MAVSLIRTPLGREHHGTGRRRVFVQTESGCVLGMELDRIDNAHMVKRRLQIALNFPIEESSLTFGDMVLKNDLSAIRNDSPLLLTRNILHRSSSTPCLSPNIGWEMQQGDRSGPVEILGHSSCFVRTDFTKQLVEEVVNAMRNGVDASLACGGLGGAYYFKNIRGENVAIVKPTDEEPFAPNNPKGLFSKALGQPGLKRSVRVGETGYREVAAYLLDYDHFANVPPTALVKITHSIFNVNNKIQRNKRHISKIASFQQFIKHDFDASDHGTSSFPVSAVHRIGILDIRIFNTDRHAGNLLVRKVNNDGNRFGEVELVPIDHGLCLPENLEDPYFEWIHWAQSSIPFSDEELEYIEKLDPYRDSEILKTELPMIREACLRVLVLCTVFLKEAASYGLCLAEIGEMMSREFRRGEEEPSELEVLCMDARRIVAEKETKMTVLPLKVDAVELGFPFEIEYDEEITVLPSNPHPRVEEEDEESEEEIENDVVTKRSTDKCGLGGGGGKPRAGNSGLKSGYRSANEPMAAGACFVKLGDMNVEQWGMFLESFEDLVIKALCKRKANVMGQRQRLRLGTSC